jgi:hypothetical protein
MTAPAAGATRPAVIRLLGEASTVLNAASAFLESIAGFFRQLVHVVGWLVLLVGSIDLLINPHVTPAHLAVPGAGALAVLQGLIKPWWRPEAAPDEPRPET